MLKQDMPCKRAGPSIRCGDQMFLLCGARGAPSDLVFESLSHIPGIKTCLCSTHLSQNSKKRGGMGQTHVAASGMSYLQLTPRLSHIDVDIYQNISGRRTRHRPDLLTE